MIVIARAASRIPGFSEQWAVSSKQSRRALEMLLLSFLLLFAPSLASAQTASFGDENSRNTCIAIARYLHEYHPAICTRNVHVVLLLDTSGSMLSSHLKDTFLMAWDQMLQYVFVPGDRFTLLPFHERVLLPNTAEGPSPGSMDYPAGDTGKLSGWFAETRYDQSTADRGTDVNAAKLAGVQQALKLAHSDRERCVLLLLVTDGTGNDMANGKSTSLRQLPALLQNFYLPGLKTSSSLDLKTIPVQVNGKPKSLILYSALERTWQDKPARAVDRRLPVVIPATPPGELPGWLNALGVLALLLALACLAFLQSSVTITSSKGVVERKISAFRRILLAAKTDVKSSPADQVWLPLDNSDYLRPLLFLRMLWPYQGIAAKATNAILRAGEYQQNTTEVPLSYGKTVTVDVGLQENETIAVQIRAHPWRKGKAGWLMLSITLLLGAIICWSCYQISSRANPGGEPWGTIYDGTVVQ